MKPVYIGCLLFAWLLVSTVGRDLAIAGSSPVPAPFVYTEDFESADPFSLSYQGGNYTLNFKGITSDRASSGNKSFKLDVTLEPNVGLQFRMPLSYIPTAGSLQFSCDLYLESDSGGNLVTVGTETFLDPPGTWISTNWIDETNYPTGQWITQTSNLVEATGAGAAQWLTANYGGASPSDTGIWTGAISLLIAGTASGGRVVVYVDNIRIAGSVPGVADYKSSSAAAWSAYLSSVQTEVASKADYIVGYQSGTSDPVDASYLVSAQSLAPALKSATGQRGYPTPPEYQELLDLYGKVSSLPQKKQYVDAHPAQPIVPYPWQPITSTLILPNTAPLPATPGNSLSISACPGEFEPTSFFIYAENALSGLTVDATDLQGPGNSVIPGSALNIRLAKAWYRAGSESILPGPKTLATELLINDDNLVLVDLNQQTNMLRISVNGVSQYVDVTNKDTVIPANAVIQDALVLQPFSISQYGNKQIWITLHVPDTAPAGSYTGIVNIHIPGSATVGMNLGVTVLPFTLPGPALEYSIYYRGSITTQAAPPICSDVKTLAQYGIEMQDILNHGILYPDMQGDSGSTWVTNILNIRSALGFPKDKLYVLGTPIDAFGTGSSPDKLSAEQTSVQWWQAIATNNGYKDLYVYGIDEAAGPVLGYELDAWQLIRGLGAKVFAAFYYQGSENALYVNNAIDLVVLDGHSPSDEIKKWHDKGKKVFMYANPQAGIEDPELYRKNYGFPLWIVGYDGAMPYAYQHAFGHIWNDFDSSVYRDLVFAFPMTNGVIDTVQWEGFREAVDDMRYLAVLRGYMDDTAIGNWLSGLISSEPTMWSVREKVIEKILSFRGTIPAPTGVRVDG